MFLLNTKYNQIKPSIIHLFLTYFIFFNISINCQNNQYNPYNQLTKYTYNFYNDLNYDALPFKVENNKLCYPNFGIISINKNQSFVCSKPLNISNGIFFIEQFNKMPYIKTYYCTKNSTYISMCN